MTIIGLVKFDLNYVIEQSRIIKRIWSINYTQKAIEETLEIPMNEYRWYFCPLEPTLCRMQIDYYIHWVKENENDKVSIEEIIEIIKKGLYNSADLIYKLVIKYDLTDAAFIFDVLTVINHFRHRLDLIKKLKEAPFNIAVPPDNRSTLERERELKRKGLTVTRKEAEQRRKIRKEMEEAYIKELKIFG
jgi:hypothetical protein